MQIPKTIQTFDIMTSVKLDLPGWALKLLQAQKGYTTYAGMMQHGLYLEYDLDTVQLTFRHPMGCHTCCTSHNMLACFKHTFRSWSVSCLQLSLVTLLTDKLLVGDNSQLWITFGQFLFWLSPSFSGRSSPIMSWQPRPSHTRYAAMLSGVGG